MPPRTPLSRSSPIAGLTALPDPDADGRAAAPRAGRPDDVTDAARERDDPAPPTSRSEWPFTLMKVAVSGVLLWLLLSRVDVARLWGTARSASPAWLLVALALYAGMAGVSAWRWALLLRAQRVVIPTLTLLKSFLVALFFNNFLPSNIGGDLVRVADTAKQAGSKTLATTVILIDRGLGLLALVLIAALGATLSGRLGGVVGPMRPVFLWAAFGIGLALTLQAVLRPSGLALVFSPLRLLHRDWMEERLRRVVDALHRFRRDPAALAGGALGAFGVQLILVAFYVAIAYSIGVSISAWQLAVIVPMSLLVQMLPVSLNGLGVREATFVFYFSRLGLPMESALLVSFLGAALVMLFSVSGAVLYLMRR